MSKPYPDGTEVEVLIDAKWFDGYIIKRLGINKQYGQQYQVRIPELDTFSVKCHDGGKLKLKRGITQAGVAEAMCQMYGGTVTGRTVSKNFEPLDFSGLGMMDFSKLELKVMGNEHLFGIRQTLTATAVKQASDKMDRELLNTLYETDGALQRFVSSKVADAIRSKSKETDLLRIQVGQLEQRNNTQASQIKTLHTDASRAVASRESLVGEMQRMQSTIDSQISIIHNLRKHTEATKGWAVIATQLGGQPFIKDGSCRTRVAALERAKSLAKLNHDIVYSVAYIGEAFQAVPVQVQTVQYEVQSV